MEKLEKFCKIAVKEGALEAKVISAKTIAVSPWVRLKCQFGCGGYGERLTCPPYSPTPEQTKEVVKSYKRAILIHGKEHVDVSKIAVKLEREIFLGGYYKAFAFGSGPCRLCSDCNIHKSCKNPDLARPAMEASGIDVFKTARSNGFKIEVVKSDDCDQNYYGLVLVE